jgi:hypothetical protein
MLLCLRVLANGVMVLSLMVMMRGGMVVSGGQVMMLLRRMLRCLCHLGVSPFCDRTNKIKSRISFSDSIDVSQSFWRLLVCVHNSTF